MSYILVTGGTGYIGSHTAVELLTNGYKVIIADNLSNSKIEVLDKIAEITGKKPVFYKTDLCRAAELEKIFYENKIDAVIHFAGYKAVGESVKEPMKYYENNLVSTMNLIKCMRESNVKNLVFSSSATVYGMPERCPIEESAPRSALNPYGATKLIIENMLADLYKSDNSFNIVLLRYFNPVGAHKSHLIGEEPCGTPNNLMPFITRVAAGTLAELSVFGNDYKTRDGTGVRDYIHVCDLAEGHVLALKKLDKKCGLAAYNLGTGRGYSVLEVVKTFIKVNDAAVPYKIAPRRPGDAAECYASVKKARKELGFTATRTLEEMCRDSYAYQINVKK